MTDTISSRLDTYYKKLDNGEDVSDYKLASAEEYAYALDSMDISKTPNFTYSVEEFENNKEVIKNYEVVSKYIAEQQGGISGAADIASDVGNSIPEWLRDETMRLETMVNRSSVAKNAPEDVKKAYRELKDAWDNTDPEGFTEYAKAVGDYAIDAFANYESIPLAVSAIFTGGTTIAASAGAKALASKALKNSIQKTAGAITANPYKAAAAYGATITGLADVATQDLEINIDRQDEYNAGQTMLATGIGAVAGPALLAGGKAIAGKIATARAGRTFDEGVDSGFDEAVDGSSLADEALEGEWIPASGGKVISDVNRLLDGPEGSVIDMEDIDVTAFIKESGGGTESAEELREAVYRAATSGGTKEEIKNKVAYQVWKFGTDLNGKVLGKAAGVLTPLAKYSKTADSLQTRLVHEFAEDWGVQKEIINRDFSEVAKAVTGKWNEKFYVAVDPLALNSITGEVEDGINLALNKAIRGEASNNNKIDLAAEKIKILFKDIGEELYTKGIIENKLENYIPRMWNRKAIEKDQAGFAAKLVEAEEAKDITEARKIINSMLDIENQIDGGTGGQFFAAKRKFKFKDDSPFTEYLNTDLLDVVHTYNFQAGKAIAKKEVLNVTSEKQFIDNWVEPISREMKKAGKQMSTKDKQQIIDVYRLTTGENLKRYGEGTQNLADGYSLVTRLATLSLATVSSLTEVFINIGKAGLVNSVKGFSEASESGFKKVTGDLHSELMTRHGLTANEAWRELKKHGMAMEQAQAQIGNRLAGDDLVNEGMNKVSNKFFRVTLLDQWTKFVQMTSFASGKNLIEDNLQVIAAHGSKPPTKRIQSRIGELKELGIDYQKGVEWLNSGAKKSDDFYSDWMRGASRYANSVVLQPDAMSGLKPSLMTNPRTTILFQLLGYPAAFTNTVLKGAAKALVKDPVRNAPKLALAGLVMTESARQLNWIRTRGESEKYNTPAEARVKAIARWGGNGLFVDSLVRAKNAALYNQNPLGYLTAPFGPIASDAFLLDDPVKLIGSKAPFLSAGNTFLGKETMTKYKDWLKEQDKNLKEATVPEFPLNIEKEFFNKGGKVSVPNAPKEPDERINKLTGVPYNVEAGGAFMDQTDEGKILRQGYAVGGIASKLSGVIAEAINEASNKIIKPEKINEAASKIERLAGKKVETADPENEYFDPMDMDVDTPWEDVDPFDDEAIDDAMTLDEYIKSTIQVVMGEKDPAIEPNSKKTLEYIEKNRDAKGSVVYGEEFQKLRGYSQEDIDNFEYQQQLAELIDPTEDLSGGIKVVLEEIKNIHQNEFVSRKVDDVNVAKIEKLGAGKVVELLSKSLNLDDSISDEGREALVVRSLAKGAKDKQFMAGLKDMIADTPDKTVGTMKMPKDMVANPALAQEQFVADSTVKTPVYRGITAMGEYDSEVSFWSPREMGTHVGGKGQAQYMLARGMNTKRAEEELALTSPDSGPVSQRQLDRFFTEELNARGVNDPRMMNLPKAQREMLQEEGMDTSIPELTMMEGYINLKKPLEFATDMSKWSAEYLTTSGSDFLVEAIEQGLGKALTKAQLKKIDMIGAFNNHQFTHKDNITTEIYDVVQTKMLQKFLKSLGFDGFKYKNMVEPNMEGEPTWSYILFDAEQFKSSLATKFDPTDRRMTYNTGGEVEELVTASSVVPAPFNNFESVLAEVENAQKEGFEDGVWKPHPSPEGGTDTIGYGHKLTKAEAASGKYDKGISDSEAITLFREDIEKHKAIVKKDVKDFDKLPPKYQDVLVNIAFNTGSVKKTMWPNLLKGMKAGLDTVVRKEMVTSFTDEDGNKGLLKTRAKKIADAVGLDSE